MGSSVFYVTPQTVDISRVLNDEYMIDHFSTGRENIEVYTDRMAN